MSVNAKVNDIRRIHTGRVFHIDQEDVTLENGVRIKMEIIRHPGAAAIVALTDNEEILLLRQYRHAVGGFIWEIPAGTNSENETPLICAQRELQEETGYAADRWEELGDITPLPGYSDERIHLFLAQDLKETVQHLDADEVLTVHKVPYRKVLEMIRLGQIKDAKTLSALFLTGQKISFPK